MMASKGPEGEVKYMNTVMNDRIDSSIDRFP